MPPKTKPTGAGRRARTTAVDDPDRDPEDPPPRPPSRPGAHRTMATVIASKGLPDRPVVAATIDDDEEEAPGSPGADAGRGDDLVENASVEETREKRRKKKKKRRHRDQGRKETGGGREEDDRGAISKSDVRGSMAAGAAGSTKKSGNTFDDRLRTKLRESRGRHRSKGGSEGGDGDAGRGRVDLDLESGPEGGLEGGEDARGKGLGVGAPPTASDPAMRRLSTLSSKETDEESLRTSRRPLEATLVQSVEATLIVDDYARNHNGGASNARDPNRLSFDSPVYEATPVSEVAAKTWWEKNRRYVIVGAGCLALGAMGATIGLLASALNGSRDGDGTAGGLRGAVGNPATGAPSTSPLSAAPSVDDFAGGAVPSSPGGSTGGAYLPPPPKTPAGAGAAAPAGPDDPVGVAPPSPDGPEPMTAMSVPSPTVEPVGDVPTPISSPPSATPTFRPTPKVVATAATTTTTTTTKATLAAGPVEETSTPEIASNATTEATEPIASTPTATDGERVIVAGGLDAIAAGGSQSLQFSYGCVFNVRTKPDVVGDVLVTGLDFYTKSTEDVEFELWTREGTYAGFEGTYDGWTLVASGTVAGRGTGEHTPVPDELFFAPVAIPGGGGADGVRALYLTLTTPDLLYKLGDGTPASESSPSDARAHAETAELEVWEGEGVLGYPFPDPAGGFRYRSPRQFVGAIYYTVQ